MALFENQANKTPLGGELVRRGLVKSADINEAVKYKNELYLIYHLNIRLDLLLFLSMQ